jgi:hypothetical protein
VRKVDPAKFLGCVQRHVGTERENDDDQEARKQGDDAPKNAARLVRFAHR